MKRPDTPPPWRETLQDKDQLARVFACQLTQDIKLDGPYLHWDELRWRPTPDEFNATDVWLATKLLRRSSSIDLPIPELGSPTFHLVRTPQVSESLAFVDRNCAGQLGAPVPGLSPQENKRYVLSALREEATQSSMLEGAATTRRQAKEMLRTGRKPATPGERMVANNYDGIRWIGEHVDDEITPERLNELHAVLTHDTLDRPEDEGRPQQPGEDRVAVKNNATDEILHMPPIAAHLTDQLQALCAFANGETPQTWLHPVERAIVCHFWMGWLHPYVDGNGRTARALFYWVMMKNGFWFIEYTTISKFLRQSPTQYARSYLFTESDDGDVTYFLLHELKILRQAIEHARKHIQDKSNELRKAEASMRLHNLFNHRQVALLRHALRHDAPEYTARSHMNSHGIAQPTARKDLLDLQENGLLRSFKRGRAMVFVPVAHLEKALARLSQTTPDGQDTRTTDS